MQGRVSLGARHRPRGDCGRGDDSSPQPATSSCERSSQRTEASEQRKETTHHEHRIAPNIQPDRYDSEEWPALVSDIPDGARRPIDARSLDPMQGSKIGSEAYDDPT
jgi:hypothetical protein